MEGFDTRNQVFAISRSGWVTEKPVYHQNNYNTRVSLQCNGDNINFKIDKSRSNYGSMSALSTPMSGSFVAFSPANEGNTKANQIIRNNYRSNQST